MYMTTKLKYLLWPFTEKVGLPLSYYSFPGGYKNRIIKHFRLLKVDAMYAIMIA